MTKCYENLAHVYDDLIYEDIDYDKISSFIMDVMNKYQIHKGKYLDIACGTGTVTALLSRNFTEVWAVDYSQDMLMEADNKLRENNIKANLIYQDMTELNLYKEFNVITCVLDAVNYIHNPSKLKSFFSKVYHHLESGGIFIFDINSYYKLSGIIGNNTFTYNTPELFYTWENDFEEDNLYMYLTFFIKEGEYYKRFEEEHIERAYSESYIEGILKELNFTILNKVDDYTIDSKVHSTTERIVYVLRKE